MENNPLQSGIHYAYQLEMGRFLILWFVFAGAGVAFVYVGSGLQGWPDGLSLLMGGVCLLCWVLVSCSFFKQKEIVFDATFFACPHQSPLRMFQTININYKDLLNVQKITHADKEYLRVVYAQGQLFIGKAMLADAAHFEEINYLLFYQLGQVLNS
ncbi:MAG: hypothetical protein AB8E82_01000 [Aureispira sp.]